MNRRAWLLFAAVPTTLCLVLIGMLMPWSGATPTSVHAQPPPADPPAAVNMLEQFWGDTYGDATAVDAAGAPPIYLHTLLAKAPPDECFNGVGVPYTGTVPTCTDGISKVNQAYVWGLTLHEDDLWFGTAPNVHCLVIGGFLGLTGPLETPSYVCEFGASQYSPPLPDAIGDWRPPKLYYYNQTGKTLVDVTPLNPLIGSTLGIRSAATYSEHVFMAGPSLTGGINIFVFDAATHSFVAAQNLAAYTNVRRWLVADGVLYVAVGTAAGGEILRYTGDPTNPTTRFDFVTVGQVDNDAAELVEHEGRIFVNTWPSNLTIVPTPTVAALWMSPIVPPGGLTPADAGNWVKVFSYDEYEPDPVTAAVYGGGAMASYGGYLFFGTMHVPFLSTFAHAAVYGPPGSPEEAAALVLGTYRAVSIFRGSDFDTITPTIDLLYGNLALPVYDTSLISPTWILQPNGLGQIPRFGASGFNNFFNNYTWSMNVYDDQLFVGTMDHSYLIGDLLASTATAFELERGISFDMPESLFGADLFRFVAPDLPALPESIDGLGNFTNYGVRNMVSDAKGLYLGMANPMNLLTDPTDELPEGGWELIRIAPPTLRVYKDGSGSGTVSSTPDGIDCGVTCTVQYKYGEAVLLEPSADIGSAFTGWTGACTGIGPCVLPMLQSYDVTATFTISNHPLLVTVSGSGTVTSTPAGVDCGSTCDVDFGLNETVNLTPNPAAGHVFAGWSGACSGTGACDVLMTGPKTVAATFVPMTYPVTVNITGTGSGAVASDPVGITCNAGTCTEIFDYGTELSFDVIANTGSTFDGWSGLCSGVNSCQFSVTAASEVTATFSQDPQESLINVFGKLFTGSPLTFTANLPLSPVDSCQWDFGDSSSESCDLPANAASADAAFDIMVSTTHVYTTPGVYTVRVTAGNGAGTIAAVRTITVGEPTGEPPTEQPGRSKIFLPLLETVLEQR